MRTLEALRLLDKETNAKVYLVGGFVRDYLRNKTNNDFDIVIRNYSIPNIKKFLSKHGTVKKVQLAQTNEHFRITILLFKGRGDGKEAQIGLPKKGKNQKTHPNNTLKDDMKHRDFTMNAMYLPVNFRSKSDIIDMAGGRFSINNRTIYTVGNALERIDESPIRIMRAISLAARTGYNIDPFVMQTMKHRAKLLINTPFENVRDEFNKVLMSAKPSKYIRLMSKLGILKKILPELDACVGVKQDFRYHKWDVFKHCIYTADSTPSNLVLRLAGLLHDIGKPETRAIRAADDGGRPRVTFHKHEVVSAKLADRALTRLKYDNDTKEKVLKLIHNHMYHYLGNVYYCEGQGCSWKKASVRAESVIDKCPVCGDKVELRNGWTDAAIRRFITNMGITKEDIKDLDNFPLFKLRSSERKGNGLKNIPITDRQKDFQKRIVEVFEISAALTISDLEINGHDIMDTFKLKQSPRIGEVLNYLLNKILEQPEANNKLELLKLATEYFYNKKLI